MRTRSVLGFVAAMAVVAAGAYLLGRGQSSAMPQQRVSTERHQTGLPGNAVAKPDEATLKLERRLAAIEAKQALTGAVAPPPPVEPQQEPPPGPVDPAEIEQRRAERMTAIEAALQTEHRDVAWAATTESQVHTAVDAAAKEGARFSIRALKCLTSLCEMVLSASSTEDFGHVTQELGNRIVGMGSVDLEPPQKEPDGSATITCRLFRAGYPRPDEGL
jgi:hypothetical protein